MTMITPQLSHTALLVSTFLLAGTAPDERTSRLLMGLAEDLADGMDSDDVRDAYEDAKVMLTAPPPDPATHVDLPPPTGGPLTVWMLTAEINGAAYTAEDVNGDYVGHTSVHMTLSGALETLDGWLHDNGIDLDTAHYGEQRTETFVGADVDPDLIDGDHLSWGINSVLGTIHSIDTQ